jgi:hypothetical protein
VSTKTAISLRDFAGTSLKEPASRPAFTGTIASACELGIDLERFMEMARVARPSDPRVASFLDAWDALETSDQQASSADALCRQAGFTPTELLKVVATAACQYSMYVAQLSAAVALPSVVKRSIEVALTDEGIADRKMQFQHAGFLPTPKGSQTTIAVLQQNAHLAPAESNSALAAPRPEDTIRRMVDRFNEDRELPSQRLTADLEPAHVTPLEEEEDDV